MEFASNPIVALLILLGVLVFGHELGHYLVGRMCGIAVEIFSIGFGPPILRWRRGETEYRISLLPLGGFVKFYGAIPSEKVPDSVKGREMHASAPYKRMLTIAAGPVANLLIAVVAYAATGIGGINHQRPVVGQIIPDSAAEKANLQPRDVIDAINGEKIKTWEEMLNTISDSPGIALELDVLRNGESIKKILTPETKMVEAYPGAEKKPVGRVGIGMGLIPNFAIATSVDSPLFESTKMHFFKIQQVQIGERTSPKLKYFSQFVDFVIRFSNESSGSIKLTLSDKEGQEVKQVEVPTGNITSKAQLLDVLKIADAQLVVDKLVAGEDEGEGTQVLNRKDRILTFESQPLNHIFDLRQLLTENKKKSVILEVVTAGTFETRKVELQLTPREVQTPAGKEVIYTFPVSFLGQPIAPDPYIEQYANPLSALSYGIKQTVAMSGYLVVTIGNLVTGDVPLASLGGPILIAKVASESAKRGWITFLTTLALISVNLAMINLLPIPVFDGGQLIIVGLEAIRQRPLSEIAIENFQKIGFVMILILMFLATYNDVKRVWTLKL